MWSIPRAYHLGHSSLVFKENKSESCFHVLENRVESHEGLSPDSFLVKVIYLLSLISNIFGVKERSASCLSKVIYLLNLISNVFGVKERSASCFHSLEGLSLASFLAKGVMFFGVVLLPCDWSITKAYHRIYSW